MGGGGTLGVGNQYFSSLGAHNGDYSDGLGAWWQSLPNPPKKNDIPFIGSQGTANTVSEKSEALNCWHWKSKFCMIDQSISSISLVGWKGLVNAHTSIFGSSILSSMLQNIESWKASNSDFEKCFGLKSKFLVIS